MRIYVGISISAPVSSTIDHTRRVSGQYVNCVALLRSLVYVVDIFISSPVSSIDHRTVCELCITVKDPSVCMSK